MTDIDLATVGQAKLVRPPDPSGRLAIYLTVIDGHIIVDFGRPVQWIGLTTDEAMKLSEDLVGAVRTARTLHLPPE